MGERLGNHEGKSLCLKFLDNYIPFPLKIQCCKQSAVTFNLKQRLCNFLATTWIRTSTWLDFSPSCGRATDTEGRRP